MCMKITVVDVDDKKLWMGAKVRRINSDKIKEIFVIPEGKTISQCVLNGSFDMNKHIDYQTFALNKHLFELVKED